MSLAHTYILIVEGDADRIDAAVRGCGEACQLPALVARTGGDAMRLLEQLGAPALLMTALTLPDGDALSVIESLRCVDADAPVVAWTADRDLREYAASRLANTRAKVLGRVASSALFRRCIDSFLGGRAAPRPAPAAAPNESEEDWQELADSARERLGVVGTAAYTKARGATEYMMSVSWRPDAPTPDFPTMLPAAIVEVLRDGVAKVWTEVVDSRTATDVALRSLAIVPIVRGRDSIGVLCAFELERNALRQDDLETLRAIAGGATPRRGVPAVPLDRAAAHPIVQRELARASRDQQPLSVMLFAMTAPPKNELPFDDILASVVRGNDLVVRWTSSEVVVVLAGVDNGVAQRVAGRIGDVVQMKAAPATVSSAIAEVGTAESLEDTIARAAAAIQPSASSDPPETPRMSVPSRGYRPAGGTARRSRPQA